MDIFSHTRGGPKMSVLFILLSLHVQYACVYVHILYMSKNIFIAYKLVSLFLMKSVYTQSFEHLNKVGVRAAMNSKLEKWRSVIKFLILDGEKPFHIFQMLQIFVSEPAYPIQPFTSGFYSLGRTSVTDKPRPGAR